MTKQLAYLINYTISKFFPALLSLLFLPIMVRMLNVKEYGELNINTQLFFLLNTILLLTTYYVQRNFKKNPSCLNEAMAITIHLSLYATIIFSVINYIIFGNFNLIFNIIIALNYVALGIYQNNMTALNVMEESKKYASYQTIYSLLKTLFGILFVFLVDNYIGVFLGMLVPLLLINKQLINFNKANVRLNLKRLDLAVFKKYFKFGIPLAIFSSLDIILSYLDVLMVKSFLGINFSGYYSGIYNILNFIVLFPQSILVLWGLPKVIKFIDNYEIRRVKSLLVVIIATYLMFSVFLILAFYLYGNQIISILLTPEYSKYSQVALILIPGLFFAGLMKILIMLFQAINKKFYVVNIAVVISIIINFSLNILLIPFYKLFGAAFATLFSYMLVNSILIVNIRSLFKSITSKQGY
ncbi:oligosaccharide flippase family protein [Bacillus sp. C1]